MSEMNRKTQFPETDEVEDPSIIKWASKLILDLPQWPTLIVSGALIMGSSLLFVRTKDGTEVAHWVYGGWVGLTVAIVGICWGLFIFGYYVQKEIERLTAAQREVASLYLALGVRGIFSTLFPIAGAYLGAKIILHGDSYWPVFLMTVAMAMAFLAYNLTETLPAIDGVASLNVALAVKLPGPGQELIRLLICLFPGVLKSIVPDLVPMWKRWARSADDRDDRERNIIAAAPGADDRQPLLQLDELRAEVEAELRAEVEAALRAGREEFQAWKIDLQAKLEGQKAALKNEREELQAWKIDLQAKLEGQKAELERREGQLHKLKNENDVENERLCKLKEEVDAQKKELETWNNNLQTKQNQLQKKENEMQKKENELQMKENELQMKENELKIEEKNQTNKLETWENELQEKQNRLQEKENKLEVKENELKVQKSHTPIHTTIAEPQNKYNRQLIIWGEQGQAALEKSSICLLNCGPTGSEMLKNLVLGGVRSVTVVDGSKVEVGDLGNNFMVDETCVGQSKAKCVCSYLQELNGAIKAEFFEEYPKELIDTSPSFFSQFTLVIATQLVEDSMVKLDSICREANVMLVFARSYGLTGFIRISVKEHTVIQSKPDHFLNDLRVNNPWPELRSFTESIDLNTSDPVVCKHTPYVIILVKMAEEWAKAHGGCLPSTGDEKEHFKDLIKARMIDMDADNYKEAMESSFEVFAPRGIGSDLQKIISDGSAEVNSGSSDFWVKVAALKEFIANEGNGEAPLEGLIPDMTSSTELYVNLQKIYQAKAEADFLALEQRVRNILKGIGRDPYSISKANIKSFCKNARKLRVCRYRPIEDEFNTPVQAELQKCLIDEDYRYAAGFYILLRAIDRFAASYNSFPGQHDGAMDEDISRLRSFAVSLLSDLGCSGSSLIEDLIHEMCRYGAAELHAVAAHIGGIASLEVLKLITRQFVPMSGTFIFYGIDHKSQLLLL